jgi:hypothetical protein
MIFKVKALRERENDLEMAGEEPGHASAMGP